MRTIDKFAGDYEFLSNFYSTKIDYEGLTYDSTEAAFQAAKIKESTLEKTNESRSIFVGLTPGKAKRLGRIVSLRPDWEKVKDGVMLDILRIKFSKPDLKQMLLDTGDAYLIEGTTWHDNYWGNCTCDRCKNITGKNMLGKTLMQVRAELKELEA